MLLFGTMRHKGAFRLTVCGMVLYERGEIDLDEILFYDGSYTSIGTDHIGYKRGRVPGKHYNFIDVVLGREETTYHPVGQRQDITTSRGQFVVQPCEVRVKRRWGLSRVSSESRYFIWEAPEDIRDFISRPDLNHVRAATAIEACEKVYKDREMILDLGRHLKSVLSEEEGTKDEPTL